MSAHAGIHYFDGRPVRPDVIATLATMLEPYGPDGGNDASPGPGFVMLARRLQIAPDDVADRQPLALPSGAWLTWDGRLDNRDDLMMELGMRPSADVADVDVVAQAVARWGDEETWRHLVGDWSAALCDPSTRTVTLAVDFMGVRPLYYTVTDSYCAWSTSLEGLVALTGRLTELNDLFFACSVMYCRLPGHTPYRGIDAVVSGHRVRIGAAGAAQVRQYWHLPQTDIRYRDPRDYQVHLRSMFRQAVSRRLRSSRPVWMELSGGWDSSSIVCMAAYVAAATATAPPLMTMSYVSPGDPESDETRFIEAVEAHVGLPSMHVEIDRTTMPIVSNPIHFRNSAPATLSMYERMRASGARVLMSGRFGDGSMGNFPVDVTDVVSALRSFRPLRALRIVREWSLATQETAWSLLWDATTELLPERSIVRRDALEAVKSIAFGSMRSNTMSIAEALGVPQASLTHFHASREIHTRWRLRERRPLVTRHLLAALALYSLYLELSSPPEAKQIQVTYPLVDRDLIEFVTAIPARVLCEPGRPRALMRDAIGPMLPERIRRRFSKGHAAPLVTRLVLPHASAMLARFDSLEVVRRGYVDPDGLRTQLQRAIGNSPHNGSLLIRVLFIEQWLAARAANSSAAA